MGWGAEELWDVDLGDARRNRRLVKIVEDLVAQPNESVPQASRDEAAVQGVYEFWDNARVSDREILSPHQRRTVERTAGHQTVLAIQDTSEVEYSDLKATRGLGPISNAKARGLKVHTILAASGEGVPLGLLGQEVWARSLKGVGKDARSRAIAEKESRRWLEGLELSQTLVPAEKQLIAIADREADIYELFAHPRREGSEFLIRAAQNRNTKAAAVSGEVKPLFSAIRQSAVAGEITLKLQRTPRRRERLAVLNVRYGQFWLQPPAHLGSLGAIAVNVVLAEEEKPPTGEKAVVWLLLTTVKVETFEAACQCLRWYSKRWLIERYFYVLKSGCRVEELQLESAGRLKRAIACYSMVAWRLLWLTYEAWQHPEQSVAGILETEEWQVLYCRSHQTNQVPEEAPSLGESVLWIAKLGGFLGRKGDGEPGVETLWRGLGKLHEMAATWELMRG
ncbi:IS4 family transposase [Trichocoleus sp. FACHB-591]|uniref:IS4 family transposase n=1 Tax=Trichocoleus sp. FACHB-591 TaxID=2692872 RepID=UPI001683E055|nr:IS4 family transposase [Trichocoleus sp. FACHB-591]MBD2093764.1 IS4 family transposase [Trichocoleus sp. FACHB-591]